MATTANGTRASFGEYVLRTPAVGPTIALIVAVVVFSLSTSTFLELDNLSLVVEQSLVVGTMALGQTLIILTAGIDLANAANTVLATLLMAKLVVGGAPAWLALLVPLFTIAAFQLFERFSDRLGLVVKVVVRPAFDNDQFFLL